MATRENKDSLRGLIVKDVQAILDDVKNYPIKGEEFKSMMLGISKQVTAIIPLMELLEGGSVYIRYKKEYTREAVFSHVANTVFNALEKL